MKNKKESKYEKIGRFVVTTFMIGIIALPLISLITLQFKVSRLEAQIKQHRNQLATDEDSLNEIFSKIKSWQTEVNRKLDITTPKQSGTCFDPNCDFYLQID